MAAFDPHHVWLGIPPREQPPDHYRLLGIAAFESDLDVIANAADLRMRYVRSFQAGKHAEECRQILNQLASARVCLLNDEKREQYDVALRAAIAEESPQSTLHESGTVAAVESGDGERFVLTGAAAAAAIVARSPKAKRRKHKSRAPLLLALGLLAVVGFGLLFLLESPEDAARQQTAGTSQTADRGTVSQRAALREHGDDDTCLPAVAPRESMPPSRPTKPAEKATRPASSKSPSPAEQPKEKTPPAKTAVQPRKPPPVTPIQPPGGSADNELTGGDELAPKRMGKFVAALCRDLDENLWVGTEDTGVWRYDADAAPGKRWSRFTRANTGGPPEPDGPTLCTPHAPREAEHHAERDEYVPPAFLGDDFAYAIACDRLGRVWVGHLNHGVSVFNGRQWRNYDVLSGPLGERVFDIAACPVDGDVWIATSAGLTRYRLADDAWTYYTRADGLPSDAIECIAFDKKGTLYAGTQCDGLAVAAPTRAASRLEYKAWRAVTAAASLQDRPPVAPVGDGLPSNLIDDVLVARDGAVYVATPTGLAASRDAGRTWHFVRGQDWEAKARGLYRPPSKEQLAAAAALARGRTLLLEDYCTRLAEDESGNLWVGHRQKAHEVLDLRSGKRLAAGDPSGKQPAPGAKKSEGRDYVTRLLSYRGEFLAGTYGAGVVRAEPPGATRTPHAPREAEVSLRTPHAPREAGHHAERDEYGRIAALPSPASRPTLSEIRELTAKLSKPQPGRQKSPVVIALPDDWRTQGDWLGRYGRYWACLAAVRSPFNLVHPCEYFVDYREQIGAKCTDDDSIRYWVHWMYTDNRSTLELPPRYLNTRLDAGYTTVAKCRRQAEWDDHGEAYPMTADGPHIFVKVEVPAGWHVLSLYFFNKDGHTGMNRLRDYMVDVRGDCRIGQRRRHTADAAEMMSYESLPLWAKARVRDFWGGAYKRFLVKGPQWLTIKIGRNYSFNTICSAVSLDRLESPAISGLGGRMRWLPEMDVQQWTARGADLGAEGAADAVLAGLEELRVRSPQAWAVASRPALIALLRVYCSRLRDCDARSRERLLVKANLCEFHLGLFHAWEASCDVLEQTTPREAELAKIVRTSQTRSSNPH